MDRLLLLQILTFLVLRVFKGIQTSEAAEQYFSIIDDCKAFASKYKNARKSQSTLCVIMYGVVAGRRSFPRQSPALILTNVALSHRTSALNVFDTGRISFDPGYSFFWFSYRPFEYQGWLPPSQFNNQDVLAKFKSIRLPKSCSILKPHYYLIARYYLLCHGGIIGNDLSIRFFLWLLSMIAVKPSKDILPLLVEPYLFSMFQNYPWLNILCFYFPLIAERCFIGSPLRTGPARIFSFLDRLEQSTVPLKIFLPMNHPQSVFEAMDALSSENRLCVGFSVQTITLPARSHMLARQSLFRIAFHWACNNIWKLFVIFLGVLWGSFSWISSFHRRYQLSNINEALLGLESNPLMQTYIDEHLNDKRYSSHPGQHITKTGALVFDPPCHIDIFLKLKNFDPPQDKLFVKDFLDFVVFIQSTYSNYGLSDEFLLPNIPSFPDLYTKAPVINVYRQLLDEFMKTHLHLMYFYHRFTVDLMPFLVAAAAMNVKYNTGYIRYDPNVAISWLQSLGKYSIDCCTLMGLKARSTEFSANLLIDDCRKYVSNKAATDEEVEGKSKFCRAITRDIFNLTHEGQLLEINYHPSRIFAASVTDHFSASLKQAFKAVLTLDDEYLEVEAGLQDWLARQYLEPLENARLIRLLVGRDVVPIILPFVHQMADTLWVIRKTRILGYLSKSYMNFQLHYAVARSMNLYPNTDGDFVIIKMVKSIFISVMAEFPQFAVQSSEMKALYSYLYRTFRHDAEFLDLDELDDKYGHVFMQFYSTGTLNSEEFPLPVPDDGYLPLT